MFIIHDWGMVYGIVLHTLKMNIYKHSNIVIPQWVNIDNHLHYMANIYIFIYMNPLEK
jgi:hypothetical protein